MSEGTAKKIQLLTERLAEKILKSATPVPGFILGVSGTDSLAALDILVQAVCLSGQKIPIHAVHYVTSTRAVARSDSFRNAGVPWIMERYWHAVKTTVAKPWGCNQDPQRWADLHLRALNSFGAEDEDGHSVRTLPEGKNFWVSGTMNATEWELGTYSMLSTAVSLQPIRSLWKTEVLQLCADIGVPQCVMEAARIPDCWCGRDEIAAENIELVDKILQHRVDPREVSAELLAAVMQWVGETKRANAFKRRVPFVV